MRIKILLVDDEELTTLALKKILSHYPDLYEVIGTASNGAEALTILETDHPHIVVVDIRMPVLDGIGFLKEIEVKNIPLYTIVLSAYRDFEYAQQALHYGASDYLLKPISQEKLLGALQKATEKIEERDVLAKVSVENIQQKRQRVLHRFLQKGTISSDYSPATELQINGSYQVLLMYCPEELPHAFVEDCTDFRWMPCTVDRMIILISKNSKPDDIVELIKKTNDKSREYFLPYLIFSLSNERYSWEYLPDAFKECTFSLDYYFYLSRQSYIPYSMIQNIKKITFKSLQPHFDHLHEYLKLGAEQKTFEQLKQIYKMLSKNMNANPHVIHQLFYEFLLLTLDTLQSANKDSGITDYVKNITLRNMQNLPTLDSLYQYILTQLNHYFNHIESLYLQSNERIVERAKKFCEQNYNTDCSLDDIANSVYISKNYLAQVFKEKTGISLWNYFTDLRMEKAKDLLASKHIKATIVGEMVGYKNPSHFGRVFKERVGLTPKEYQQRVVQST
ncbi:response regulator transcription factor [Robinsoniella sp. KNHs210]|uniref:response regulator transcription factor n=1 Tax=Robinsoniella sp. KNHs210 TaxID=1469950 RepID=UPI000488D227|nr:response regulator [Robinsoniella sp. KNHs210]